MDAGKVKDVGATAIGGMSGTDMLYTGIQGMLDGGVDGPEIKLVFYGLVSIVLGFFAWRKEQAAKPAVEIANS